MGSIKMFNMVVPRKRSNEWEIGTVVGMSDLTLSVGPVLHIRDMISGKLVERLPMHVHKLVVEK